MLRSSATATPSSMKTTSSIAVSQSGETADTLAAVELARKAGAFVFGICNVVGSSIARATDSGAYIHVGPEIGVASTKAFTGQVTVMAMLALAVGRERGTVDGGVLQRGVRRRCCTCPRRWKRC